MGFAALSHSDYSEFEIESHAQGARRDLDQQIQLATANDSMYSYRNNLRQSKYEPESAMAISQVGCDLIQQSSVCLTKPVLEKNIQDMKIATNKIHFNPFCPDIEISKMSRV